MKKIISLVLACVLLTSSTARAENTDTGQSSFSLADTAAITPLKKNQPAPFTGVLLTPKAVATIITETPHSPQYPNSVQINFDKEGERLDQFFEEGGSRKNHFYKPKFTRRKNKNSPKRKTIKKRKMPKRKNKTRRNK